MIPYYVYLSGPMRSIDQFNYPAFHAQAKLLRAAGFVVYNPAEYDYGGPLEEFPIRMAFAEFSSWICDVADAVYVLPGIEFSMGAKAEVALARAIGLPVVHRMSELQAIAAPATKKV